MYHKLGHNIKMIRELKNYSQSYMARSLKISQPSYSDLENGKIQISLERLQAIAQILGVEVSFMISFSEEKILKNYSMSTSTFPSGIQLTYAMLLEQKDDEISYLRELLKMKPYFLNK